MSENVRTILVIDDEPMVLDVVVESLQRDGYQVTSATNTEQALQTASSLAGRLALIIVNHSLSSVPARNLVEAIERLQPGVKVLRYSGYTEELLRKTGQIKPEAFFLQKPFTAQVIRRKVRDIVGPPSGSV